VSKTVNGPQTVLYIAWAPFYSGAERALVVLVENLDRARYRPIVAIGTDGELAQELRSRQIQTVHQPIVYLGARTLPAWVTCVARLSWVARRERAVIIHSNDVPSFQPAGYAARIAGLPALTHVRFPDTQAGFSWFLKPGIARALFVSADLRADAIRQAPETFQSRSDVVYDGVHVPPLASDAERRALRAELGLPLEDTLVVMAGQVAEIKGIWDYIDAAAQLAARRVPVKLVVLGDDLKNQGATRLKAEQIVRERGLTDTVTFLGFRPNAQRLIPAFDIVAVPSHVEPLGNATLEAMATARPVIGARVGGIPEMVVDGETGVLVPSRGPARLADAIAALVADPAKAQALGRAGHARAIATFSVTAHVNRVASIYDRCLGLARDEAHT
jgi:glycosyltransferase involved in cell wall biosynthesis